MRNLKKVLGLILCLAMMLSLMVVGAGAAFIDQSDIDEVHQDAVNMCVSLKIIDGFEDGSFKPNDNVTREQMAKMICVLDNGGKDPQGATGNTFTDVPADRWSNKYVESCAARGVVSGVGDNKFDPASDVTATQAAKMLLVELGYNEDFAKYTGDQWATYVNIDATKKGYYEDLEDIDVSAPMSREHAAQMIWNALQADEVDYKDILVTDENGNLVSKVDVYDTKVQLLADKYGTKDTDETTGVLCAISYNTTKDKYTYTLDNGDSYKTDVDFTDLFGHNVTFVVKDNSNEDVMGAYAKDSNVIVSGLWGDIDFDKDTITVDDTDYDVEKTTVTYFEPGSNSVALGDYKVADDTTTAGYNKYVAIDNDDNDKIDTFIIYPVYFGEINYVGSDYVKFKPSEGTVKDTTSKYSKDDYTIYDDPAKEDYATLTADVTLKTYGDIAELDKGSGTLSAYDNKSGATIDSNTYDYSALGKEDQGDLESSLNDEIAYREINGYLVWIDTDTSANIEDYVLVTGVASGKNASGNLEAELLFTDGTSSVVTIKSVDGNKGESPVVGVVYTFELSSGKYELTGTDNKLNPNDYDAVEGATWQAAKSASDADAKVVFGSQKASFDDAAVVFVYDVEEDTYVVKTGADVSKITSDNTSVIFAGADKNSTNALSVKFAYIETDGVASSDWQYGFVTSNISSTKDSDGTYKVFTVWNGTESVEVTTASGEKADGLEKGVVVGYKLDSDNKATDVTVISATGAITVIDGDAVTIDETTLDCDKDDTVVIYVDKADNKGIESGSLAIATEKENEGYFDNVVFMNGNDSNKDAWDVLVVDINNDWNEEMD